jgi:iron complex transport system ATP-binding protein
MQTLKKNIEPPMATTSFPTETARVITTRGLTIGYKQRNNVKVICGHLNLTLNPGQLVCLLGPNGAGKSTLMRTLAGLQPALSGEVFLKGKSINHYHKKSLSKQMSLVLTEKLQADNLSVYSIITLGRYPYLNWFGQLREQDKKVIRNAIRLTGVAPFLQKQSNQLSDGEKQKVMITRALVQDTPLIILDEPTAHLDLPNRVKILRLLRNMARSTGKAILLSTHELDLALQAADLIWLMMPDKTIVSGAPEDLILQGTFESAFQKAGLEFDRYAGTFKLHQSEHDKQIALSGGQFHNYWTKRALQRAGYLVNQDAPLKCTIEETKHAVKWKLYRDDIAEEFTNIENLIKKLNKC